MATVDLDWIEWRDQMRDQFPHASTPSAVVLSDMCQLAFIAGKAAARRQHVAALAQAPDDPYARKSHEGPCGPDTSCDSECANAYYSALAAPVAAKPEGVEECKQALLWLASGDTGASSEAIVYHMLGLESDGSFPYDPSDLGRCLRMLEKFPQWKPRIGEMAKYSGEWAGLAENWCILAATMADEVGIGWVKGNRAPTTYAAMKIALASSGRKGGG